MKTIQKNRPRSEEERQQLNKARLNMTEEQYRKAYRMRRVACFCAKTGKWLADYGSQKEAIATLGVSTGNISDILSGKIKNPKKYLFKFID